MLSKEPKLSIVILCYRAEEQAIIFAREMLQLMNKLRINYELVLVANHQKDSANSDRMPKSVRDLAVNNLGLPITVVAKNLGKQIILRPCSKF